MQEAIFKVNRVKEVAKIYIKLLFKYGDYETINKKGIKHVKNVVQSLYLKQYQTNNNGTS